MTMPVTSLSESSAMKVRADRETWPVSSAVPRVRDRLSAESKAHLYR